MKKIDNCFCEYGCGICSAPDTICPHWRGTFCELDRITTYIISSELDDWDESKRWKGGNKEWKIT